MTSSTLRLEDSFMEHNVGISVFWTHLLLVVSLKEDSAWWLHFQNSPCCSDKLCFPLVLSILILTQLFPCHFCPRSITVLIMLFDPITIVPISVSTEIWPVIYHGLSKLQLLYIPSKILSSICPASFLALGEYVPLTQAAFFWELWRILTLRSEPPLCKDWACLVSGSALGTCFVLFIYSHGIKSTLHQK